MTTAFVFPGQGSQQVGMMDGFADDPVVRATFAEASEALGEDLWQLVREGPSDALGLTRNTQPVMLTAGVAVWRAWQDRGGTAPSFMAGHSLGEYTALVAAGAISFSDALPLVRLRAKAMQEAVPQGKGAMAAILGLDDEAVRAACAEAAGGEVCEAVNFNAPSQVVIAGHAEAVKRAMEAAKARGAKRAVPLPVSAPFHSSLMAPAAAKLREALSAIKVSTPRITVIHNVDAKGRADPEDIRKALVAQADHAVRWVECVREMGAQGATHVFECGPGKILAPLTKRIADGLQGLALADRAGLESGVQLAKGA
jgi:[acyl-carrier-protein] S-malonyltransferase